MYQHVFPQRFPDPDHPSKNGPRVFLFIKYSLEITSEMGNWVEVWFPYSDGDGCHSIIHNATLNISEPLDQPRQACLYIQSPDENTRVLVHKFDPTDDQDQMVAKPFIVPHQSRGVLCLNSVETGTVVIAQYMLERFIW